MKIPEMSMLRSILEARLATDFLSSGNDDSRVAMVRFQPDLSVNLT